MIQARSILEHWLVRTPKTSFTLATGDAFAYSPQLVHPSR